MRAAPSLLLLGLCLTTLTFGGCDSGSLTPEDEDRIQLEAAMDCSVRMITLGSTVNGELNADSCRTHGVGPFIAFYGLRLDGWREEDYLQIDMAASTPGLNPYLILLSSDGQRQIAFNDDIQPPAQDARIRVRGLQPGLYAIAAKGALSGQMGAFTIRVGSE